ncbi:B12-binding domain-containing radical SAM protein [Roseibium sediminicola]|uniref:B12-binding domain-containing radical SAM protein n=1 Tax=Roseibium sediminicola TaxID=2933272 RepID=A0ABT0GXE6_9HYPH|nr:B12-binding domain-containing radical SAM protein [Roseibium sp. CAU 1639]MCK7614120.1 B12-binding domain-containing radical SAM protein [Roseibium sp. CAU 1639]
MSQCNVLLVYPRFNAGSFWNYGATCEMVGAKYPAPPLGLITVAAMLPEGWNVRLVDRNTGELTDSDFDWADMIMTGGMLPQQADCLSVIRQAQEKGIPVAVGGPDATSSPEVYEAADFLVLGEAEGILNTFIDAWNEGARKGRFTAEKFKADVTSSPIPRFDLLKFEDYVQIGVQYSRGCPFTCEFCDIIELYGRVPRTKTNDQILAELDRLYELGYRGHVDFVDDNLIGNKKAVKGFLPELAKWQKARKYPFEMSTEASLNLADDEALLKMMQDAGYFSVFIGIESPDPDVLVATRKKQNTRRDIAKSVHKIYEAGIFVLAGFIVGFDEENDRVADEISALIEEAAIPVAMTGLLYALPNTQLTRRLAKEGRLHADFATDDPDTEHGDQCTAGLNFSTVRPREQILEDFKQIIDRVYGPEAYFGRVQRVASMLDMSGANGSIFGAGFFHDIKQFGRLMYAMTFKETTYRWPFWKTLIKTAFTNFNAIKPVMMMLALYVHLGPFSRFVIAQIDKQIADIEKGHWQQPTLVAAE